MKILQHWVSIRLDDPAFAKDSKISSFRKFFAKSSVNFEFFNPPKKERRSLEEGVAAQQRKRLLWRFSIRKWIRLKWNKIRGELFDFIFHEHGLLSWSLFRRKVDNNLSSFRFGTYGRKKIASMRGEFLGIEVRLRVRKRAKWRGECEWESLARLWRCASIRISNTSISTYFHDKRIFLFRESFGEIVGYWTEE